MIKYNPEHFSVDELNDYNLEALIKIFNRFTSRKKRKLIKE